MRTNSKAVEAKAQKAAWKSVTRALVMHGQIDPSSLTAEAFRIKCAKYILDHKDDLSSGVAMVLDHKPELLKLARKFRKNQDEEMATVFYATWCEHWANAVLVIYARRHRIPDELAYLATHASIAEKLRCLGKITGRPIPKLHRNSVKALGDRRNEFLHYKWRPEKEGQQGNTHLFQDAERTVSYLSRYWRKWGLGGKASYVK